VADEPTGDLDRASAPDVLDLMERLNPELGKTNRIVSLGMVVVGSAILVATGKGFALWLEAFSRNAALAALLITIPMLNIPYSFDDYYGELKRFAQKYIRSPWMFCLLSLLLSHFFGLIILVGAIPLVFQLFHENAKLYHAEDQFISALVHGQVFGGFWSPVWSSMIILTSALQIPWLRFIPLGIGMSFFALTPSMIRCHYALKKSDAITLERDERIETDRKRMLMVVMLTILPIILIILLKYSSVSQSSRHPDRVVLSPSSIGPPEGASGTHYREGMGELSRFPIWK
jgi:hypothetical protein